MAIIMKIVAWIGAVLLVLSSVCVTFVALFPPKEYNGDGKTSKSDVRDESIEDA